MINYTERIALLMADVVNRTPLLSFIDLSEGSRLRQIRPLGC